MATVTEVRKFLGANANKKSYFVRWYVDSDKTKESYDKECKKLTLIEYEHAMSEWLFDADVQEAIKQYLKMQRNIKMLEIYEAMYTKALEGEKQCADWCSKFFKSDFFESAEDEIDNFLEGINIPSLNKGGE